MWSVGTSVSTSAVEVVAKNYQYTTVVRFTIITYCLACKQYQAVL